MELLPALGELETAAAAAREQGAGPFDFAEAVTLKTLAPHIGRIETNAAQVLSAVAERVKDCRDISRYEGRADAAKKDRALLRKEKDALNEMRKNIEAKWNSPLEAFRARRSKSPRPMTKPLTALTAWLKKRKTGKNRKNKSLSALTSAGKPLTWFPPTGCSRANG